MDKDHPLFLVFSGPGTGKSRLLDELPELAKRSVKPLSSFKELHDLLDNAFVFKISFENGMRYLNDEGVSGDKILGTRMMWQMSPMDTLAHFLDRRKEYSIMQALDAIPRNHTKPSAIFLLVDGLQMVPHTVGSSETIFADIIKSVCNRVNDSGRGYFVVGAIAATFSKSVDQVLHDSPQKRCSLYPHPLDGHAIIKSSNMFVRMLVDDMGGHGRALEMLMKSLQELGVDLDELRIDLLASTLRLKLQGCYPSWFKVEDGDDLIPVFESVLARQKFASTNSHISLKFTVEDVVRLGLIRWNPETHMLEVPFILFWLLTTEAPNTPPLLRRLARDNVSSGIAKKRTGLEGWRAWEEFVADFQSLKSKVFDGKEVTLEELHAGARLSDSAAKSLIRVSKKNVVWTTKHYPSRSDEQIGVDIIEHEHGEVSFKRLCDAVVVNGPGAPAADVFSCVHLKDPDASGEERGGVWVNETFACRHRQKETLSQSDYENEREKAAGPADFFMMFVTGDSNVNLESKKLPPSHSGRGQALKNGLVDSKNFSAYFGPFAGRAFCLQEEPPNINTAPRSVLGAVEGIGPARAKTILQERVFRPFINLQDAVNRTQIPEHVLNRLTF